MGDALSSDSCLALQIVVLYFNNIALLSQLQESECGSIYHEIYGPMSPARLREPALAIDCEIGRGSLFITKCIKYCYSHLLREDELPPRHVGSTVLCG
jgi:hypothetical protein